MKNRTGAGIWIGQDSLVPHIQKISKMEKMVKNRIVRPTKIQGAGRPKRKRDSATESSINKIRILKKN